MPYTIRFTRVAKEDLARFFEFLADKDPDAAEQALSAIRKGISLLEEFPFTCRKIAEENPFLRELLIPFGSAGYVLLFEIENDEFVTILAARHQREDDYR